MVESVRDFDEEPENPELERLRRGREERLQRAKLRRNRKQEEARKKAEAERNAKREAERACIDMADIITPVVDSCSGRVIDPPSVKKPASTVPFSVGKAPPKSPKRKPKGCGLTKRLIAMMDVPAAEVEATRMYCEHSGIDPSYADVGDCLVHNLLHWTMQGSAPHLKEVLERIDGKVPMNTDQSANGKMSITDAMNMIAQRVDSEKQLEYRGDYESGQDERDEDEDIPEARIVEEEAEAGEDGGET